METITYEYVDALYVNLTNRCDCGCVFCLRQNGHKGSIYADDLWLEHEPTREEALRALLDRDLTKYRELVFCGFGEADGTRPAASAHQYQWTRQPPPRPGRMSRPPGPH